MKSGTKNNLIAQKTQHNPPWRVGAARFTGLCSLDGCSEAPMDGFMASRETSCPNPDRLLRFWGNLEKQHVSQ